MFGLSKNEKLRKAAEKGDFDKVVEMIDKGANINAENIFGQTALMLALNEENIKTANLLINCSADINHKDIFNMTPLMKAAQRNSFESAKLLVDRGADLNYQIDKTNVEQQGETALMIAIDNNHAVEIAKLLIEARADLNRQDKFGETALMKAVENNHKGLVKLLLEHGADLTLRNIKGQTALFLAIINNNEALAIDLIKAGATLDIDLDKADHLSAAERHTQKYYGRLKAMAEQKAQNIETEDEAIASVVETYRRERNMGHDQRLVEVFDFAARIKTSFIQAGQIISAPTEVYFDTIPDQVNTLRPIWEIYQAQGGTVSEDSIFPGGGEKAKLSSLGITQDR